MIQRAQTIYLGLAFICMVLLLVFPIFSVEIQAVGTDFKLEALFGKDGVVGEGLTTGQFPLSYVFIGLALLSFAGILLYKKRPRQLLFMRLNLILHVLLVLGVYAFYFFGESFVQSGLEAIDDTEVKVVFLMEVGFFLLIPTIAFIYLAIRGIKRDENLVTSLDRLR